MTFDERIETLKEWIAESKKIVFFTGAGISTGSGIPDFRSEDGLYQQPYKIDGVEVEPEYMLDTKCLKYHPNEFFDYLQTRMNYSHATPNLAHKVIADLQKEHQVTVITQNIDGLHTKAGSERVYEIHGTFAEAYCVNCGKRFPGDIVFGHGSESGVPMCDECFNSIIRPDIVLYGEGLNWMTVEHAYYDTREADLFIIVGSSMTVYPAAGIPSAFRSHKMVVINRDETQYDDRSLVFREDINDVFKFLETDA